MYVDYVRLKNLMHNREMTVCVLLLTVFKYIMHKGKCMTPNRDMYDAQEGHTVTIHMPHSYTHSSLVVGTLPPRLGLQTYICDNNVLTHCLAHVIHSQCGHTGSSQCLHFHTW